MIFTKNFHPNTDPKLLCTCGHVNCDKRSVNQFTLDNVQLVRNDYGKPMIITSGGRCSKHKHEINKADIGDHQRQYAVDVFCDNELDSIKLMVLAGRHGATRVAHSGRLRFVHIAWTPTSRKDVPTWRYL
jgi:zinc D-Ala-D-Ala carboxypeptidase